VAVLRELARRSAIPVDVGVTDMGRLQPEIEATAYYIAAEATVNAVKHGNAGHVNITLADVPGGRLILVSPAGCPAIVTADLANDGCQAARR
jgi:signal transduction histidine kinase